MKYLKITNKGLLDIRLVYLMGGTTKANDKFKIGQFGTGLKYTLAFMLRNNIDFKIFIDGKEVKISTHMETIRETDFEIIHIDGEKTSITTNMGMDWKAWMIMRELWCNALDEENPFIDLVTDIAPEEGNTEYYIQCTGEIADVWASWDKYFIKKERMIMDHENFSIYEGGETLRIYKNGVLIKEEEGKAVFAYDVKDAHLNELREFTGSPSYDIARLVPFYDKKTVEILLEKIKDTFEDKMDYDWHYIKFNDGWKEALGSAKVVDYDTYRKIEDRYPDIEKEVVVQVPKTLYKKLITHFPSISLVRASDKLHTFYEVHSEELIAKIERARSSLEDIGYFIDPELKILIGVFGNTLTQGEVDLDAKEIRISVDMEKLADTEIIYVLVEENEHFRTGFRDETREFQTHFIKLYVNSLFSGAKVKSN